MPQVWRGLDATPPTLGRCVVTIGVFDGVHLGHRAVVGRAVARARAAGLPTVVLTFDPHPVAVLRPAATPPRLATLEHRIALLGAAGADGVCVLPFTRDLAAWSPQHFVEAALTGALHAAAVVVGADFRFGHRAAGDLALLESLAPQYGFAVEGVALAGDGGRRWSSSYLRERIAAGDVEEAARGLGRPHRVEGVVVVGDRRGRDLGYPTANVLADPQVAVPADGVYAGLLTSPYGRLPAAVSVGTNPTFDGSQRRVESYVLDRDDLDLYGEHVAVDFTARLRGQVRFASVEDLLAQMADDVRRCRAVLGVSSPSGPAGTVNPPVS